MLKSLLLTFWPILTAVGLSLVLELIFPWRKRTGDFLRWLHAGMLYVAGALMIYVVLPLGSVQLADLATVNGWGIFNFLQAPHWTVVIGSFLVLEFCHWLIHRLMHQVPVLWRLHRLHHSDEEVDTSTAFRFHPGETLVRMLVDFAAILVLGIPALVIVIRAVLTLFFDIWQHANVHLPQRLRFLSYYVVTPELHRVHHDGDMAYQNSNFGALLSLWDRLFGSFKTEQDVKREVAFGLGPTNTLKFSTLANLLFDPFRTE